MEKFYVYILQSEKDQSYYIGYTYNLDQRLHKHNTAKTGYTSRKQPWKIVYTEEFETKKDAIKRERFLKKQKSRSFYERIIREKFARKLIVRWAFCVLWILVQYQVLVLIKIYLQSRSTSSITFF